MEVSIEGSNDSIFIDNMEFKIKREFFPNLKIIVNDFEIIRDKGTYKVLKSGLLRGEYSKNKLVYDGNEYVIENLNMHEFIKNKYLNKRILMNNIVIGSIILNKEKLKIDGDFPNKDPAIILASIFTPYTTLQKTRIMRRRYNRRIGIMLGVLEAFIITIIPFNIIYIGIAVLIFAVIDYLIFRIYIRNR